MAQQTARPYTHRRRPTTSIRYNAAWVITAVTSHIRTQALSRIASRGATPSAQCAWAFHTSEALAQVTAAVLIALSSVYKFGEVCYSKSTIEPAETNANVDFAGRGGPLAARPSPPPPASSANTTAYFITATVSSSTCSSTYCSSAAEPSAAPGTCRAGHEAFQNNATLFTVPRTAVILRIKSFRFRLVASLNAFQPAATRNGMRWLDILWHG